MPKIDTVLSDRVLIVRIDNRSANAMNSEMAGMLEEIVRDASGRREIGALLLTGARGRNFCAGSDIRELARLREEGIGPGPLLEAEAAAFDALADLDIPTVAAIDGAAAGGGLELAICCDLIVASDAARFSLPEIKLGVFPALGGTVRLVERIGQARATEMLLLGETVDGPTALTWGLANRLVAKGRAFEEAKKIATVLAHGPREAQKGVKDALRAGRIMTRKKALDYALALAKTHADSEEVTEGLRAFAEGEEPDFTALPKSRKP